MGEGGRNRQSHVKDQRAGDKQPDRQADIFTYIIQTDRLTDRQKTHWGTTMIDRGESRKLMSRLWANNITSHPQQCTARAPYLSALLHCILGVEGQCREAMGFERRSAWTTHWFAFNSGDTQTQTSTKHSRKKHMHMTNTHTHIFATTFVLGTNYY